MTSDQECCAQIYDGVLSQQEADNLADLLKALADPVRLRLVSIIAAATTGEVCACDLPDLLDRSQPTISHHLTQLTAAGVVTRQQRGKWAWFRLQPDRLTELGHILIPRPQHAAVSAPGPDSEARA